jgi:hypothetical protein
VAHLATEKGGIGEWAGSGLVGGRAYKARRLMGQQLSQPMPRITAKRNGGGGDWICSKQRAATLLPPGRCLANAPSERPSGGGRGWDWWAYGAGTLVNHTAEQVRLGQHSGSRDSLPSAAGALEDRGRLAASPSSIVGLREMRGWLGKRPPGGGSLPSLQRWGGLARRVLAQGAAGDGAGL